MTVTDLIRELQAMPPHMPVKVVLSEVYFADESGETMLPLCDGDAIEVDEVRHMGPFVLVRSK